MLSNQTPEGAGSSVAELRPSGRDYARRVLPGVPVFALIVGFRTWAQSHSILVALIVVIGIVLLVTVLVLVFLREAYWEADAAAVHARSLFGRVRTVPRSDVASVLLATSFRSGRARPGAFLALRDRSGRGVLRLQGPAWDADQIEQFLRAARLGPVSRIDEPVDAVSLRRLEPGVQGSAAEHPGRVVLITLGIVIGVLALVFGAGALLTALGG